jgi:RNA polymerase sigma-70 factor (ECF subfamily)
VVALFRRRTSPGRPPHEAVAADARLTIDDRQWFAARYHEYFPLVYRYAYARLGSHERAEDAAHQVFAHALEAFDRYEETGRAREWLFAIAHNVIVNEAARRTADPLDESDDILDSGASPETQALAADDTRALHDAVARLPRDQRRAIELRIAGLTGREIAAEMGRSPDAVKMMHLRAIDRLRAELGGRRKGGRDGS